ncbi:MAG: ATP-binding protein [archaeon]|nr:ATP-binding protein [archaeon]
MKSLPIGIQDFKVIRDGDKYFVDKSMLIGQIIEQNDSGVFLYTRPRRFGKSLNLSMIDAFFNIEYKGNKWFDGLEISNHPEYNAYRNVFPVITFDFKMPDVQDFERFIWRFNQNLIQLFRHFNYLVDSPNLDEASKDLFKKLYSGEKNIAESEYALTHLCTLLEIHHGAKVIVLLDEYDSVMNGITDPELRREILSFMRGVLSPLLKGNSSLQMGVVTGIMQIAKENIFSGLNNLYVNNILSERFDEMYGFTDDEVRQICTDYGHPEKFEEAKEWYDGYRFGNADIYNPWSILNYVSDGFKARPYWVNTSSNSIVSDLLSQADDMVIENLGKLGSGEGIVAPIKTTVTFEELSNDPELIYSMMAVSGYLKAIPRGSRYLLSLPNRELYSVFAEMISDHMFQDSGDMHGCLQDFCDAIVTNDVSMMEKSLYELVVRTVSSRVLNDEHSYQAFIAGLLMTLSGRYSITADFESGKGYYDIRMERRVGSGYNVIMELKRSDSEDSLPADAEKAMTQIRERDYAHGLEGRTILYGISFYGKVPHIISDMI